VHACIYMASCTEHVINFIGMQVYNIWYIDPKISKIMFSPQAAGSGAEPADFRGHSLGYVLSLLLLF
jgi:hypothetical protein